MERKGERHLHSDFLRHYTKPSKIFNGKEIHCRDFHCGICDYNFGDGDADYHGKVTVCPKCKTSYEIWGNGCYVQAGT